MSNLAEILQEEFEVLESIYPDELERTDEHDLGIRVEPEEQMAGEEITLLLQVHHPPEYPDAIPEMSLEVLNGSVDNAEETSLMDGLKQVAEESLGMAMVFTLVSHLRDALSSLVQTRVEKQRAEAAERARLEAEAEAARIRGTPVTVASFTAWKAKFDAKRKERMIAEDEERSKGLSPKEREETKKMKTKQSGRQLFEKDRRLATSDDAFLEEGVVSVDITQYERTRAEEEDEEENIVKFSDPDSD